LDRKEGRPFSAFNIQGNHVGLETDNLVTRNIRINGASHHFNVFMAGQLFRQYFANKRRIVNNQNFDQSFISWSEM
jgi:acid stress-induced BolA-like protein IbaG/YrbA